MRLSACGSGSRPRNVSKQSTRPSAEARSAYSLSAPTQRYADVTKLLTKTVIPIACLAATLAAADSAWKWAGSYGNKAVSMLIIGDIDIQRRADPTTAFLHIGDTLRQAD